MEKTVNFKIYNVTTWSKNNYDTRIAPDNEI